MLGLTRCLCFIQLLRRDKMSDEETIIPRVDEAVRTLHKRAGLSNDAAMSTYGKLVHSVLSRSQEGERLSDHAVVVAQLRDVLYKVANQYRLQSPSKQSSPELEMLLMATHYQHMLLTCQAQGLKDLAAKCSITLLKYPDVVQADKAFYQAGLMCKTAGDKNLAFMLWNRYEEIGQRGRDKWMAFLHNLRP